MFIDSKMTTNDDVKTLQELCSMVALANNDHCALKRAALPSALVDAIYELAIQDDKSNISYYDSNETCDWSGYSHDYHCSKCNKPKRQDRTIIDESAQAANHRANDRVKLVSHRAEQLNAMKVGKLRKEFKTAFGIFGDSIRKADKIAQLMTEFVIKNKPHADYRLALKIYKLKTKEWHEWK